jgi:predicted kinase
MRRFDQAALLSRMAQAGALSAEEARDLADVVYESHRTAQRAAGVKGATRIERLVASVLANLTDLHGILDPGPLHELGEGLTAAMNSAADVLDERAAAGFVRRCHGDLHLNNIVIWHGRPALFDAIEFDDDLATIDTLYDLAFLLMDLDQRGQRAAANAVLNRYLWRSGLALDLQGLRALPLCLGLRSAIRAMVTAQRCEQEHGEAQSRDRQAARRYLNSARAYLAPAAPRLVAVGGLSGTGKSTLARALAPEIGPAPGAVHLRSDLERKSIFGAGETVPLGPDGYTRRASERVYATLNEKMRLVLAAGHAGIVDAVFAKPAERAEIEAVAAGLGVPFQGLWLEAPPDVLFYRVAARSGDASDATPDVVRHQLAYRIGDLAPSWTRVDAGAGAPATLARARDEVGDRP